MKIHYLIHAPFEKLGVISDWAKQRGYSLKGTHSYRGEKLPHVDDFDFLVIMGGPQSAVEIEKYPYLLDEAKLAEQAIVKNKYVLGVCLGAQIIGHALGARAEKSPHREIGVFPVNLTAEAKNDPIFNLFPQQFDVMHWHSDMPGLAKDVVWLAHSEGCPRQAFRYGNKVYGFQCHFELTTDLVKEMVTHCADELQTDKYIHSPEQLLSANYTPINERMVLFLDKFINHS